jgi:hypothetical protein
VNVGAQVDEIDKGLQVDHRVQRMVLLPGSVRSAIVCADG